MVRKRFFVGLLESIVLLSLLASFMPSLVASAWSSDSSQNTAICTAAGDQNSAQTISDGSGGYIIVWVDQRGSDGDIYAQRIDAAGVVQWAADGVPICAAQHDQINPQLISDGSGGAIIAWADARTYIDVDIYAQRIDAAGATQWSADGVAICTATSNQIDHLLIPDGSGGAIIAWQDARSNTSVDIYAQRTNATGAVQWTADGVAICTAPRDQDGPQIVSDGSGGYIIAWTDYRGGTYNSDIYAQRLDAAGAAQWAADGIAICNAPGYQDGPRMVAAGSGGAMITWQDYRTGSNYDIYAQRIDAAGAAQWAANGVAICTASGSQSLPRLASDGSGGAVTAWCDRRSGSNRCIYAQRIDMTGAAQWTTDGVAIWTGPGDAQQPALISDGSGGAVIAWQDFLAADDYRGYVQKVSHTGAVQWTTNGVAFCTAPGSKTTFLDLVSDGSGGAVITWEDYRSGASWDIYAQRVGASGSLDTTPPTVTLSSSAASPTKTSPIPVTATFSKDVTGFALGDISVGNGSASNFAAVSGSVCTFDLTPNGQGVVTVDVVAGVAQDPAGNGNTAATQFSITYDSIPPTVTLTSTVTSPTKMSPIPMTATFSEAVTGFVVGDISVGNATASNFIAVSGSVSTFDVTPSGQGMVTVDVAASVAQDAATNSNTAATQFSITYDSTTSGDDNLSPTASNNGGVPFWVWILVTLGVVGVGACGFVFWRKRKAKRN
jgi:hypothetical protein